MSRVSGTHRRNDADSVLPGFFIAFSIGLNAGTCWTRRQPLMDSYIVCNYCHEANWIAVDAPFVACDKHHEQYKGVSEPGQEQVEWERIEIRNNNQE